LVKFGGNGINFLDAAWMLYYQLVTRGGIYADWRDEDRDGDGFDWGARRRYR